MIQLGDLRNNDKGKLLNCTTCGEFSDRLRDGLCPACYGLEIGRSQASLTDSIAIDSSITCNADQQIGAKPALPEDTPLNHSVPSINRSVLVDSIIEINHGITNVPRSITFHTAEPEVEIYACDEGGRLHYRGKTRGTQKQADMKVVLSWTPSQYHFLLRKKGFFEAEFMRDISEQTSDLDFDYPTKKNRKPAGMIPQRALLSLPNGRKVFWIAGNDFGFGRGVLSQCPQNLLTFLPSKKGSFPSLKHRALRISKEHGIFRITADAVKIKDLSSNGTTFTNGLKSHEPIALPRQKWMDLPKESELDLGDGALRLIATVIESEAEITGLYLSRPEEPTSHEVLLLRSKCWLGFDKEGLLCFNPEACQTQIATLEFHKDAFAIKVQSQDSQVSINNLPLDLHKSYELRPGDTLMIHQTKATFQTACDNDFLS
jgi:hypothetical protein